MLFTSELVNRIGFWRNLFIHFDDIEDVKGLMRVGGQVDVQVYSTESYLVNLIGKIWIRLLSYLSYMY